MSFIFFLFIWNKSNGFFPSAVFNVTQQVSLLIGRISGRMFLHFTPRTHLVTQAKEKEIVR